MGSHINLLLNNAGQIKLNELTDKTPKRARKSGPHHTEKHNDTLMPHMSVRLDGPLNVAMRATFVVLPDKKQF